MSTIATYLQRVVLESRIARNLPIDGVIVGEQDGCYKIQYTLTILDYEDDETIGVRRCYGLFSKDTGAHLGEYRPSEWA